MAFAVAVIAQHMTQLHQSRRVVIAAPPISDPYALARMGIEQLEHAYREFAGGFAYGFTLSDGEPRCREAQCRNNCGLYQAAASPDFVHSRPRRCGLSRLDATRLDKVPDFRLRTG